MGIGKRIKIIRGTDSQREFSEKTGIHKNTLGKYERGDMVPGGEIITQLCVDYNINPQWLILGNGPMYPPTNIAKALHHLEGLYGANFLTVKLDIAKETLDNLLQGAPASDNIIQKLKDGFVLNHQWLLDGKGPMLQTEVTQPQQVTTPNPQPPLASTQGNKQSPHCSCDVDLLFVPRIKAQLSAGNGSLVTDENVAAHYSFKSDWLHTKGQPKQMVILFVSGTSMQPDICHNDMVMIDQSQTTVIPGNIYAVGVDDAILVKCVDVAPGQIILRSKNQEFPPIHIERKNADQVKILGRVVWMAREY